MSDFSRTKSALTGAACGAANGLFGSGGGMLAVPMLENGGLETKKAHATSLALTLPLTIVSAFVYFQQGSIDLSEAAKYIPGGIIGVCLGSVLMKKLSAQNLKRLFGAVMIYFGIRMIL